MPLFEQTLGARQIRVNTRQKKNGEWANRKADFAQSTIVDGKELWKMFAKTGDIEWYSLYRSMIEDEPKKAEERTNANSRLES